MAECEGRTTMSAMARDLPGAELDETIAYEPNHESGHDRPVGSPEMSKPTPTPQGTHRYTFSSGTRPLDGYTIRRAIGRGGFGEVYFATSDSGKEVALKLILRNLEVERRGVVQCMNLKCPHLLTIHDLKSNDAGDTFVIMEHVAGPSLANVLAQYPHGMPLPEVRAWLKGLVEGVAYLHDHGIVHRDLKPANLFMEEGIVKIGDYGLAKLIAPSQGTEHSESIGTCHYMAPEIASGKYHKPIDIYAIGVILYEMLTGSVPFEGETVGEVLMKHLTAQPDLSKLPDPYNSIVARALAKDPNQRPSRVYELLPPEDAPKPAAVRFIGEGKTAPPRPPTPEPGREDEEILRIGPEEPVFYIGPEARPRRLRPTVQQWLRASWAARRGRRAAAPPPRRVSSPGPRPAPVVPPEPPPLPSGRVRVAELAGSMLASTPIVALLALPTCLLLGIEPVAKPELFAYLVVLASVGTWALLATGKACEGRAVDPTTRRLFFLAIGLILGVVSLLFEELFRVGPALHGPHPILAHTAGPIAGSRDSLAVTAEPLLYFGLLFFITNWTKLTARDRKARFRLWPIAFAGLVGAALTPLSPSADPHGVAVGVLVATTTQLVSPWDVVAATYARSRARNGRRVA
jgi:eukaryotic-like serine/threonine-protein kinase